MMVLVCTRRARRAGTRRARASRAARTTVRSALGVAQVQEEQDMPPALVEFDGLVDVLGHELRLAADGVVCRAAARLRFAAD
jgi:hypothetical protein